MDIQLVELLTEDVVGQHRAHLGDAGTGQVPLFGIFRPEHHMDMRVSALVVVGSVPAQLVGRYPHGIRQLALVSHEEPPPAGGAVIAQTGSILPAQGVDDGPHSAGVIGQLLHGDLKIHLIRCGEEPMISLFLHPGPLSDVRHVPTLRCQLLHALPGGDVA